MSKLHLQVAAMAAMTPKELDALLVAGQAIQKARAAGTKRKAKAKAATVAAAVKPAATKPAAAAPKRRKPKAPALPSDADAAAAGYPWGPG